MKIKLTWTVAVFVFSIFTSAGHSQESKKQESVLLTTMEQELNRSFEKLKEKGTDPLYFMSYYAIESDEINIAANYGAITYRPMRSRPQRYLTAQVRIGSHKLDNTHQIRGAGGGGGAFSGGGSTALPIEDDPDAIRTSIWLVTDRAFKEAQEQFTHVKTNREVMVEEEDTSDDFSQEKPSVYITELDKVTLDKELWVDKIRKLSTLFKKYPYILHSGVSLSGGVQNRFLVSSEGTKIQSSSKQYRLFVTAQAKADDGMGLELYDSFEVKDEASLPNDSQIEAAIVKIAENLKKLSGATIVEPYAGPAILVNRSAAVFFHEIFGHRIEGHRQKNEEEGQTFTKKIGKKIMPDFMSIADDPTVTKFGDSPLFGFFQYDDEGVPAQNVQVVENGVLKNFLMSRSPVKDFPKSNGHGRGQFGAVGRQGNLIVTSTNRVPMPELRKMLIEEAKSQGKNFGLIFNDISGGFTLTQRGMPQSFSVLPLIVTRVYVDESKPDEIVRGVNIVGTPIASLEQIIATGNDEAQFNGYCGAESGWIPVSAVSPSVLVKNIEIERRQKEQDRPPILPPPLYDTKNEEKK
ncbi:peptidase U62 [Candidatus Peregrinibacteria bacterium]|nr:peptidase U62 [Candidatus Peregrinibacteria bacterium]